MPTSYSPNLAYIKTLIKNSEATLQSFAEDLGITRQHFSCILNGHRPYSDTLLKKTAGLLETSVDELCVTTTQLMVRGLEEKLNQVALQPDLNAKESIELGERWGILLPTHQHIPLTAAQEALNKLAEDL